MKAWLTYDYGDIRLEDLQEPEVKEGYLKIKMEVCQPSVTDAIRFKGKGTSGADKIKKILKDKSPYQLFGHEFCGIVTEKGKGVKNFNEGDRVSSRANIFCESCKECSEGNYDDCVDKKRLGVDYPGCFAEYVVLPETALEPVPEGVTPDEAACLQPLSSCVACVETAQLGMGSTVVILGLGVMGLYCAQIAKVSGAGKVIGTDVKDENLALASKFGVDEVIDARKVDVSEVVKKHCSVKGAPVVFEAAGGDPEQGLAGSKTLKQAFDLVRRGGKVIQVAHPAPGKELPFELQYLRKKSVQYLGPRPATSLHFSHGAYLVATKRINISSMISHILQGIESVPEAMEITEAKNLHKATNPAQVVIWDNSKL